MINQFKVCSINEQFRHFATLHDVVFINLFLLGYEERSLFIYENYFSRLGNSTNICFVFDDYKEHKFSETNYPRISTLCGKMIKIDYSNSEETESFINTIIHENKNKKIFLNIDYSSMPRSCYSSLMLSLIKQLRKTDKAFFWYSLGGHFTGDLQSRQSSGISSYKNFLGKATVRPKNYRTHFFGLGYDLIRANSIYSVLDPNNLIVCLPSTSQCKFLLKEEIIAESKIINHSSYAVFLPIDNFPLMILKLKEMILDQLENGDVILVPDGYKPLNLALSIMPELLKPRSGVISLHLSRHSTRFAKYNVLGTKNIFGFSYDGTSD